MNIKTLSLFLTLVACSTSASEKTLIVLIDSNAGTEWTTPLIRMENADDWLVPANTIPLDALDIEALKKIPTITLGQNKFYRLSELGNYDLDENNSSVKLTFSAELLTLQTINLAPKTRNYSLKPDYPGLVLGFSARARYDENTEMASSSLENSLSFGYDRWSLNHNGIFFSSDDENRYEYRRGDSFAKGFFPESMQSLVIGDTINESSELGSSTRIAGIKLFRDFSSNPGFISSPSYVLSSQVAQPSTLELYVNDQLQYSQQVRAGQVDLQNLYGSSYGSDVEVRFRDELGNIRTFKSTLFGNQSLLKPGLTDFSLSVGSPRLDENDYNSFASAGNFRLGITEQLTAGAFFEANNQRYLMFGSSAQVASSVGDFNISVAASQLQLEETDNEKRGVIGRISFNRNEPINNGLLAFRVDAIKGKDYFRMGSTMPSSDLIRSIFTFTKNRYSISVANNIFESFNSTALSLGVRLFNPLYLRVSATNFSNTDPLYTVSLGYQPIAYTSASSISSSYFSQDKFDGSLARLSLLDIPNRLLLDANYAYSENSDEGVETRQSDVGIRKSWDAVRAGYRFSDSLLDRSHAADISTTIAYSAGHFAAASGSLGQSGFILAQAPIGTHTIKVDGRKFETDKNGMRLIPVSPFMNRDVQLSSDNYLQDGTSDAFATYPYTSTLFKVGVVLPPFLLRIEGETGKITKELKLSDGRTVKRQDDGLFFMQDLQGPKFTLYFNGQKHLFTLPAINTKLPTVSVNFEDKTARIVQQLRPES